MGCRCNERAIAIRKAAVAIAHGNVKAAADAARFVRDSAIEDAADAATRLRQAAAARLGARGR